MYNVQLLRTFVCSVSINCHEFVYLLILCSNEKKWFFGILPRSNVPVANFVIIILITLVIYFRRNFIQIYWVNFKYYMHFFHNTTFEINSPLEKKQPTYTSKIKPTHLDSSRKVLGWRIPEPLWLQLKNLLLPLTQLCWHDFDCAPLTTFSTTRFMSRNPVNQSMCLRPTWCVRTYI